VQALSELSGLSLRTINIHERIRYFESSYQSNAVLSAILRAVQRALNHTRLKAKARIQEFPIDSAEELIAVNRHHIERVLNMYIAGKVSDETVEEWANFIEGREDLDYEVFGNLIYILANPFLEGKLTTSTARKFLCTI
jgi:hypothetical protein